MSAPSAKARRQPPREGSGREDELSPVYDHQLVRRLWPFVRPHRGLLGMALLVLPLASVLSLVQPWLLKKAIDDHLVPGTLAGLDGIVAALLLALVGEFVLRFVQFYWTQRAGQAALRDLRCHIFEHLQTRALSFFHRQPIGRLMARLTSDVDALQEALSSGLVAIIGDTVTLLGIVGILVWTSPKLSLVTFAVVPVLLGLTFLFRILMRRAYRELRAQIARLNAYLNEAVTGMRIIQIARAEWTSFRGYDAINEAHRDAAFRAIRWDAMLFALVEMLSNVAVAGILWFGAGQTLEGAVTLGGLIAFIGYVQKFFVPIRDLSQKYTVLQSAMAASERIFGVLDDEDAIPSPEQGEPIEAVGARIAFEGVWFAYKGEDWVLRDVSFAVDVGEKLAVVGHTGAGKSTIVQLLLRLYDVQRGRITIDGVDIRDYDLRALRRLFSLVLQDGFLFSGTVRDNVTLRSPEVREVDVAHACDVVGLDRVVGRLEAGLDHEVRERGSNLSAGERQLVTFARALAHRPEVLVLDEATANVDTETEASLQEAIDALLAQQTSIVVAHRLSTIRRVDRIVVLHKGEVVEVGDHASLCAADGRYAQLVRLQFGRAAVAD